MSEENATFGSAVVDGSAGFNTTSGLVPNDIPPAEKAKPGPKPKMVSPEEVVLAKTAPVKINMVALKNITNLSGNDYIIGQVIETEVDPDIAEWLVTSGTAEVLPAA